MSRLSSKWTGSTIPAVTVNNSLCGLSVDVDSNEAFAQLTLIDRVAEESLYAMSEVTRLKENGLYLSSETYSETEQKLINISLESIQRRTGLRVKTFASESAYNSVTYRQALEGLGEFMSKIWENIKKFFSYLWEKLMSFFDFLLEKKKKGEGSTSGGTPKGAEDDKSDTLILPTVARAFFYDDRTDSKRVVDILNKHNDIVRKIPDLLKLSTAIIGSAKKLSVDPEKFVKAASDFEAWLKSTFKTKLDPKSVTNYSQVEKELSSSGSITGLVYGDIYGYTITNISLPRGKHGDSEHDTEESMDMIGSSKATSLRYFKGSDEPIKSASFVTYTENPAYNQSPKNFEMRVPVLRGRDLAEVKKAKDALSVIIDKIIGDRNAFESTRKKTMTALDDVSEQLTKTHGGKHILPTKDSISHHFKEKNGIVEIGHKEVFSLEKWVFADDDSVSLDTGEGFFSEKIPYIKELMSALGITQTVVGEAIVNWHYSDNSTASRRYRGIRDKDKLRTMRWQDVLLTITQAVQHYAGKGYPDIKLDGSEGKGSNEVDTHGIVNMDGVKEVMDIVTSTVDEDFDKLKDIDPSKYSDRSNPGSAVDASGKSDMSAELWAYAKSDILGCRAQHAPLLNTGVLVDGGPIIGTCKLKKLLFDMITVQRRDEFENYITDPKGATAIKDFINASIKSAPKYTPGMSLDDFEKQVTDALTQISKESPVFGRLAVDLFKDARRQFINGYKSKPGVFDTKTGQGDLTTGQGPTREATGPTEIETVQANNVVVATAKSLGHVGRFVGKFLKAVSKDAVDAHAFALTYVSESEKHQ